MRARIVALLISGLLLSVNTAQARDVLADSSSWKSAQFNLSISWRYPWTSTKQASVPGDYDMVQLTAAAVDVSSEVYGSVSSATDPSLITHEFLARFRTNITYAVKQEWENCQCDGSHPMIITYQTNSGVQMTEAIDGWSIDPSKSVVVRAFSYPTGSDGVLLRNLDQKISYNIPPPRQQDMPTPRPTPTVPSNSLRDALNTTPFTSDEFPGNLSNLTATRVFSNPLGADIAFSFGNANSVYIGYWVESDANAAYAKLAEIAASLAKNDPVPSLTIHYAPPSSLIYDIGSTIAIYSVEGNVIVAAYVQGVTPADDTFPYDLDKAALQHFYNVKAKSSR